PSFVLRPALLFRRSSGFIISRHRANCQSRYWGRRRMGNPGHGISEESEERGGASVEDLWYIRLLGQLCAERGGQCFTRFRTKKTAALLAYLAYHSGCSHLRESLIEQLWPDDDPEAAHNRFRVALTSLRRQLEPPDVPPGSVLLADRTHVRLHDAACTTDV